MNSGLPLFQFNRGQRAERRGLLSHTESNNSLTDNVTHNARQSEDRKGAATGLSESALRTTRLQWGKVGHVIWNVSAKVWQLQCEITDHSWTWIQHTQCHPHTHTHTATKNSQANEFHSSYYISSNASVLTVPASMYNSLPLIWENIWQGKEAHVQTQSDALSVPL